MNDLPSYWQGAVYVASAVSTKVTDQVEKIALTSSARLDGVVKFVSRGAVKEAKPLVSAAFDGLEKKVAPAAVVAVQAEKVLQGHMDTDGHAAAKAVGEVPGALFGAAAGVTLAAVVTGVASGASVGAAAGAPVGGVGAVPGAVVGAIAGGLGAYFGADITGKVMDQAVGGVWQEYYDDQFHERHRTLSKQIDALKQKSKNGRLDEMEEAALYGDLKRVDSMLKTLRSQVVDPEDMEQVQRYKRELTKLKEESQFIHAYADQYRDVPRTEMSGRDRELKEKLVMKPAKTSHGASHEAPHAHAAPVVPGRPGMAAETTHHARVEEVNPFAAIPNSKLAAATKGMHGHSTTVSHADSDSHATVPVIAAARPQQRSAAHATVH